MKKLTAFLLIIIFALGTLVSCGGSKRPGLYDARGRRIASWDELDGDYKLDLEFDYESSIDTYYSNTLLKNLMEDKPELSGGKRLVIDDSVTKIGVSALSGTTLSEVVIPDSVRSIGEWAFYASTIREVNIPEGITIINVGTFDDCKSLLTIELPESLKTIDIVAFNGCDSLTDVYYAGSSEQWEKIDIGAYNDALKNATIHFGK